MGRRFSQMKRGKHAAGNRGVGGLDRREFFATKDTKATKITMDSRENERE